MLGMKQGIATLLGLLIAMVLLVLIQSLGTRRLILFIICLI